MEDAKFFRQVQQAQRKQYSRYDYFEVELLYAYPAEYPII